MENNIKKHSNQDVYICNPEECFRLNHYQCTYLSEKIPKPYNKQNLKCSLCAYDFDNLEKLREQICSEMQKNRQIKSNILKTKILEFIIMSALCVIIFCGVFYFLVQAYSFFQ